MERKLPRTRLGQLLEQRNQTIEEAAQEFEAAAVSAGEGATLTPRNLRRWLTGEVKTAHASSRRVALRVWGEPFEVLVGPPWTEVREVAPAAPALRRPPEVPPMGGAGQLEFPAGPASVFEELAMTADESARFVRRARQVSPEVLEQLDADVVHLAEQYMRRAPFAMFKPLAELRRDVFGLLDGHTRPEQSRELYRVAGLVSALLAHLSSDLGFAYGVETHTRTALICADLCGDSSQRAYVHWVQAQVEYWQKDYRRSAEYARQGQLYATAAGDQLRLVSQEARALAALGDERETSRVLQVAAEARERAVSERPGRGVFHFAPGKAAYYAAEAHLALGGQQHLRQAARDAQESLDLFDAAPGGSPELVAAAQLDLVTAHVALEDLDSGAEQLAQVLRLPVESRTVPVIERAGKIRRTLTGDTYADSRTAAELRDQLEQFLAYPAARELPQLPA
ncbi:hypothetical protein ACFWUU_40395 [Kribbella sp. NPDC058693]|uniref:hypothetical protein n=1 Tax=Kribbella sp. NPDC058693 TaxID=3346602 RepID=UPI00364C7AF7